MEIRSDRMLNDLNKLKKDITKIAEDYVKLGDDIQHIQNQIDLIIDMRENEIFKKNPEKKTISKIEVPFVYVRATTKACDWPIRMEMIFNCDEKFPVKIRAEIESPLIKSIKSKTGHPLLEDLFDLEFIKLFKRNSFIAIDIDPQYAPVLREKIKPHVVFNTDQLKGVGQKELPDGFTSIKEIYTDFLEEQKKDLISHREYFRFLNEKQKDQVISKIMLAHQKCLAFYRMGYVVATGRYNSEEEIHIYNDFVINWGGTLKKSFIC